MGHLFPTSVLLTELRDRGHDIVLRTLAAGVEIGRDMGFATEAVDPRIEAMPLDDWKATNRKARRRRVFDVFARRAEYEVDDLRKATANVSPDVVIVDANCWGAAAVAEASGLPWLSWPRRPGAELRVLAMQRKLHHWARRPILVDASMIRTISSMTRSSWWLRGNGCGATRVHAPPGSTGSRRTAPSSALSPSDSRRRCRVRRSHRNGHSM